MGHWERIEPPFYQFWSEHVFEPKEIEKGRRVLNGQTTTLPKMTLARFQAEVRTGAKGDQHSLIIERNYYPSNDAFVSGSPAPFVISGASASSRKHDDIILKDPQSGENKKVADFFGHLVDLDDLRERLNTTQGSPQLTSIQVYVGNFDGNPGEEIAFKLKSGAYAVFRWVE